MPKPILEIFVDGGARGNPGPAGGGFVIFENGRRVKDGAIFFGEKTNNQAEYMALLEALKAAAAVAGAPGGSGPVEIYMDSELIVRQMKSEYKVKKAHLKELHAEAVAALKNFTAASFTHIPREKNELADALANRAMDRKR